VATNFRDKTQMKAVFEREGVPCARHEQVTDEAGARRFEARVGYPFVVKPPAGAGARGTFRIDSDDQLANWLAADPPTSAAPLLLEEFLTGIEHSFDSVTIDGRRVWHSIGRYDPSPLHVLENPWIQWCVVLPNDIDIPPYQRAAAVAEQAVAALGLHTGFSHLEWFLRPDGAAYLRAQGSRDRIIAIHGLDDVSPETEALVVESRLPRPGGAVSPTYEGDGYVIVRHPDTLVVERALREIVTAVRVEGGS
jgi:biotin carboxylase